MRIFAVRDESLPADKILAYLIYYEKAKVRKITVWNNLTNRGYREDLNKKSDPYIIEFEDMFHLDFQLEL